MPGVHRPSAEREPLDRVMGIILKFEVPRKSSRRAVAGSGQRGPCEIIILPCIRYERNADGGAKAGPQKKNARKRRARAL